MGSGQVVIRQKENKVLLPEHAVLEAGPTQWQMPAVVPFPNV